jgi:hypothetical protein
MFKTGKYAINVQLVFETSFQFDVAELLVLINSVRPWLDAYRIIVSRKILPSID